MNIKQILVMQNSSPKSLLTINESNGFMKQKSFFLGLFLIALIFGSIILDPGQASGLRRDTSKKVTGCAVSQYIGQAFIEKGRYSLHIIDVPRGSDITISVYSTNDEGDCKLIGQTSKDSDYVGIYDVNTQNKQSSISLHFSNQDRDLSGLKPQIIFNPASDPPCQTVNPCKVEYANSIFELKPKTISPPVSDIRIRLISSPSNDDVAEVLYAVNEEIVYRSDSIEEFNTDYVKEGEHVLSKIVTLNDGQVLVEKQIFEKKIHNAQELFSHLLVRYQNTIQFFIISFGLAAVFAFVYYGIRLIRLRRQWQINHGLKKAKHSTGNKTGPQKISKLEAITLHRKAILLLLVYSIITTGSYKVITNHIIVPVRVNGISMEPTLADDSRIYASRFNFLLSSFNGTFNTPKRGDIVLAHKPAVDLSDRVAVDRSARSFVIKRVVGLPNETVTFRDNKLVIINEENPNGFFPDDTYKWLDTSNISNNTYGFSARLNDGELYLVGDNRSDSIDSRIYGPVSVKDIYATFIKF